MKEHTKKIRDYKDLEIWQLAVQIIVKIYRLFATFPKEEKYGIVAQGKDSANSIAANIAEGWGRFHFKDRIKFLYNSRGSLFETDNHLVVSEKIGFINKNNQVLYDEIITDLKNLSVKINNSISAISRNAEKS